MNRSYPNHTAPSGGHRMTLAFLCPTLGHGEPWVAFWGQRYAVAHDPDGNPADLFAPL